MNDTLKNIIVAYANNYNNEVRSRLLIALKNDKSEKDAAFCNRYIGLLENQNLLLNVPANIKDFVTIENPAETFTASRYYLAENERKLLDHILETDIVSQKLQQKKIRYTNTTLLHGESGTGKTTFAKYVAYKLGVPFVYLNFSSLISSYLGKTGFNIHAVFNYFKDQRCVLMLDEIDAIGIKRNKAQETGEMSRIVISLMQALDTINNDTIILAATNRADIIDPALMRRFANVHEVNKFTPVEAFLFAKQYFDDCNYDVPEKTIKSIIGDACTPYLVEKKIIDYIVELEMKNTETI